MENNPVMRLIQRLPADGTIIIYREYTSTDGSPAVDIGIKFCSNKGLIKQQRVHFVKDKDNEEIQSSN